MLGNVVTLFFSSVIHATVTAPLSTTVTQLKADDVSDESVLACEGCLSLYLITHI